MEVTVKQDDGAVHGGVRLLLRAEAATVLLLAVIAYMQLDAS